MGYYERTIGPRIISSLCAMENMAAERKHIVPEAAGVVLEIGMGPGHNLEFYNPDRVSKIVGVDPHPTFVALGAERRDACPIPVDMIIAPAEDLNLPDASIDTAVITFTLCSVTNPMQALAEIRRVLKPGGRVLFLEHGLSPDQKVARWQNRLNPLWKRFAVGCNLNRSISDLLVAAGFKIEEIENFYVKGDPKFVGYLSRGIAQVA